VLKLKNADYAAGEEAVAAGHISTWGVGQTTVKSYKDAGCVHPSLQGVEMPDVSEIPGQSKETGVYLQYDEFIAYNVAQVQLRYLFRVKMN
jgi:poly [ADP-ribose] polymerase 2/3/4